MRVFRIESERNIFGIPSEQALRWNRFGAFNWNFVSERLLNIIPGPLTDFGLNLYFHPDAKNLFFAFPSFDWIAEYFGDLDEEVIIVSEYEVEPYKVSQYQVIFNRHTAKFISEVPLRQLVS